MIFRYDMSVNLVTFDYYAWLVQRLADGATEIVHDISNGWHPSIWSADRMERRFESIIQPGPALAGIPSRLGTDGEARGTHRLAEFVQFVSKVGNEFPRLRSKLPPRRVDYTVTLRRQDRKSPWRNSNEQAWRSFAEDIGAHVIDDYDYEPIDLHDRMALYAGAKMNFGISCGPMFLLTLTPYPVTMFNWGYGQVPFMEKIGLKEFDWLLPNQTITSDRDTLENLRSRFRG